MRLKAIVSGIHDEQFDETLDSDASAARRWTSTATDPRAVIWEQKAAVQFDSRLRRNCLPRKRLPPHPLRPAAPYRAHFAGSPISSGKPRRQIARKLVPIHPESPSAASAANGTKYPVSPSFTTSRIPPVALATTGAPHAIASRLMIPNGSYTDGQQNTRQFEYSWIASGFVTIFSIHTMLPPAARAASTPARISAATLRVSVKPAHSTTCIPFGEYFHRVHQMHHTFLPRNPAPQTGTYGAHSASTPYFTQRIRRASSSPDTPFGSIPL